MIAEFSKHYALTFRDAALLKLALTHRSYLHVTGQRDSNERLEFLGDSVLGLVTSEFLYRTHPTEHEGQLTKTKSLLVSKAILSRRALAMGLGRFVLMSHSEVESGGRQRLSILADAFESVVGAIYLDQGFEAARAFIERWLLRDTRSIVADKRHTNYKSHLQEYVQSTYRTHPVYRIRSEMGPDHSKQFMVEVIVGKRTLGDGKGRNKKEAEQAAARNALERVERGPVSDRGLRANPREEREPAARPSRAERNRPTPVLEPEEVDDEGAELEENESDDDDAQPRRRRRGRRGGRGRRRAGETREDAPNRSSTAPAAAAARPEPSRRPTPAPPPKSEVEPKPVEIEPAPRSFDEDENEEVGRPDGPRGESRVDPYAWGGADFRGAAPAQRSAPSPPPRDIEDEPEPDEVGAEQPLDTPIEPARSEGAALAPLAERGETPKAPEFGRRRSRR